MAADHSQRHLRCPVCGLAITVPAAEALPDEGPTCAMGHEPAAMDEATSEVNHG